jgi:hypothetical protein
MGLKTMLLLMRTNSLIPRVSKPAILQKQTVGRQFVPQFPDQGLLGVVVAANGQGHFDVRAHFHQTHLPQQREGAVPSSPTAAAEVVGIGRGIGNVLDCSVDGHESKPLVEGSGRTRCGQRPHDLLEHRSNRFDAQALTTFTQAAAGRRLFAQHHSPSVLENLPQGQVGQQAHSQNDPQHGSVRQLASALSGPVRLRQGLFDDLRRDNLPQPRQPIQDKALRFALDTASVLSHASRLPETPCFGEHKVSGGGGLR